MKKTTLPTIGDFKKQAKELKKQKNIQTYGEALEALSRKYGYRNWSTIKSLLKEDEKPLISTTVYTTLFLREVWIQDAPFLEISGSKEDQENSILFILKEEYGKEFETFEEAWIFYLEDLKYSEEWIFIKNETVIVKNEAKPKAIFSNYYGEKVSVYESKYYEITISDALQKQEYSEYYLHEHEVEKRDDEISELDTSDWSKIFKENVLSTYSHMYKKNKTSLYEIILKEGRRSSGELKGNGSHMVTIPSSTKEVPEVLIQALCAEADFGDIFQYKIEIFDVNSKKVEFILEDLLGGKVDYSKANFISHTEWWGKSSHLAKGSN